MKLVLSSSFEWTLEHLAVVNDIQSYGGSVLRGKEIKALDALEWPSKFTKFNGTLYRLIAIKPKDLNKTIKPKYWSSWTKDRKVAEEFIHHFWFREHNEAKDNIPVLLKLKYSGRALDIDAIHNDIGFQKRLSNLSFADWKIVDRHGAAGIEYEDSQREVYIPPISIPWSSAIKVFK